MSSIPHLAYDSPCPTIPTDDIRRALAQAQRLARQQWHHDNHSVDFSEYEDVAAEAISRCLARFEPSKARFHTYCERRIRGALQAAKEEYLRWRILPPSTPVGVQADHDLLPWLATLSPWLHRYATLALDGYTQRDIAAHMGITESAVSKRLKWWRTRLAG